MELYKYICQDILIQEAKNLFNRDQDKINLSEILNVIDEMFDDITDPSLTSFRLTQYFLYNYQCTRFQFKFVSKLNCELKCRIMSISAA